MNSFHTTPACLKNRLNRIRLFLCSVAIVLPGLIFAAGAPRRTLQRDNPALSPWKAPSEPPPVNR